MIAYASRTGTRSTLARLRAAGWRLLVSAAGELRFPGTLDKLDRATRTARLQGGLAFDDGIIPDDERRWYGAP